LLGSHCKGRVKLGEDREEREVQVQVEPESMSKRHHNAREDTEVQV